MWRGRGKEGGREGAGEGWEKTERMNGRADTAAATRLEEAFTLAAVIHLHNCGNISRRDLEGGS